LAEILVSILIFTVVSLAMITILITSTNLFRAGEYGRASTDEAVAALGAIDDDLKRMVPARDGGFFLAQLHPDGAAANGNCVVAFMISQAQATAVGQRGQSARRLVLYWVEQDPATKEDALMRADSPTADEDGDDQTATQMDTAKAVFNGTAAGVVPVPIARRCLHFGAWISTDAEPRSSPDDWNETAGPPPKALNPTSGQYFCTEADGRPAADPFPTAVRFTLALAGGRYAPAGYVIEDSTATIRIAGISSLPTTQGSLMRIDDEWIRYSGFANGAVQVDTNGRAAMRSTQQSHGRNARVMLAQLYSLARIFPH
jgi:hypothetical protein